ncbi:MAG TPA: DUF3137 domain-containing protein [bacterium]|nr:DUF3137 domain-containing protein [bacterium]
MSTPPLPTTQILKSLETVRQEDLQGALQELEAERLRVWAHLRRVAPIFWITGIASIFVFGAQDNILQIIPFLIWAGYYWHKHLVGRQFVEGFKDRVLRRFITTVIPGMTYDPKGKIDRAHFQQSGILGTRITRYNGEDLMVGQVGATMLACCELDVTGTATHSEGESVTFNGLFFVIDFPKGFSSRTYVLSGEVDSKRWQREGYRRGQEPHRVMLEDPEFNAMFWVYSLDPVEARYLLSTSFMERLITFRRDRGLWPTLTFIDNHFYVGMGVSSNFMEPKLHKTVLDSRINTEFLDDFRLVVGLVEDLNLNLRIWGEKAVV